MNFPDFEEQFEVFENLASMNVNIALDNTAKKPARTQLLLTGLQLPVLPRKKRAKEDGEVIEHNVFGMNLPDTTVPAESSPQTAV